MTYWLSFVFGSLFFMVLVGADDAGHRWARHVGGWYILSIIATLVYLLYIGATTFVP